jgi:excisionase family DNA binding protein
VLTRYLPARAAAQYLGFTIAAVYQLVHRRQIPHSKRGRRLIFDRQELDRWIAEGARPALSQSEKEAEDV